MMVIAVWAGTFPIALFTPQVKAYSVKLLDTLVIYFPGVPLG
jgi:hypothetical protein